MAASIEGALRSKVEEFALEQQAFSDSLPRFSSEARAREAFERIRLGYLSISAEVTAHLHTFNDGHGGIIEGREEPYLFTTEVHQRLTDAFSRATSAIHSRFPSTSAATSFDLEPLRDHTPKTVMFYYSGKGDLFIHGTNLITLNEYGIPTPLSWEMESRIPLKPVADNLWSITIYVPTGKEGEYKISNSGGTWSSGPNHRLAADTSVRLQTPVFETHHSICIPLKIIPDAYKLCLFGEGTVRLHNGEELTLDWHRELEMTRMGSALWSTDATPVGTVKYKICLVGPTGLLWEKGADRTMSLEEPLERLPDFGSLPDGVAIRELSPDGIRREDLVRVKLDERLAIERAHEEAHKGAGRAVTAASKITGEVFSPADIIETHPPVEFAPLFEEPSGGAGSDPILKAKAHGGKWVIFQQGKTACTAGASACLLMDMGIVPSESVLKVRTSAPLTSTEADLQSQGLRTVRTHINTLPNLKALKALLDVNGSAALRIVIPGVGGHAIVVDEISADLSSVRIRDPWHGWDVTVTADAFLRYWRASVDVLVTRGTPDYVIQVDRS